MVTLHEELLAILASSGNRWMSIDDLARAVNTRGQYEKRDGSAVAPSQIHLRTRTSGSYEALFERQGRLVRARPAAPGVISGRRVIPSPESTSVAGTGLPPLGGSASAKNEPEAAWAALNGPRWSLADASAHIPPEPGLYAIYGDDRAWQILGLGHPPDARPLYVGKSESSLYDRDFKTHFANGRTGSSTVRRSFAALLREELDLHAVPRNVARPGRFANYALPLDADLRLTAWMGAALEIAVWPTRPGPGLGTIERALMQRWQPPLNLVGVVTPWTQRVKATRAVMAAEARRRSTR